MAKMTKVMATKVGHFDNKVREIGDVFEVPTELLTAKKDEKGKVVPPSWFEEVVEQEERSTRFVTKTDADNADNALA